MAVEESEQSAFPDAKRPVRKIIVLTGVLVILAFLIGFLPPYVREKRLESDLSQAKQENRMAQLRDLAGLAYLQASQKNYGLATGASARFFERTREVADGMPDSGSKKALEDLLIGRDEITSGLAKGDPGVLNNLEALFVKTRQATGIASGASQPQ